jgi:ABC-type amino acid transport substrate-binding protein
LAAIVEATVDTFYFDGTIATIATTYFGDNVTEGVRTVDAMPEMDLTNLTTIEDGVLKVGMEVGYPPMEYLDDDGLTEIGFDVELAQKMAEKLGLELEIVNTAWDGIFAALEKGEFDMIMSSVSITPERQEKFILTAPYISNKIVLAVPNA